MKWTEGHIWVVENLLIYTNSFFTYKYVVMKQDKAVKWEQGPNRIADLNILPDRSRILAQFSGTNKSRSIDSHYRLAEHESSHSQSQFSQNSIKAVILKDEWEHFTVRFSAHTQFEGEGEDDVSRAASALSRGQRANNQNCMRIMGSLPQLTKSGDVGSGP